MRTMAGGNLVLESSNSITTEYVLDENRELPVILGAVTSDGTETFYAYSIEGFAAQKVLSNTVEYPLLDGLGSIRHFTNGSGTITPSRSYDTYGTIRFSSGTSEAAPQTDER